MAEIPQEAVRNCIKAYLQANGLTNKDLADRLGITLPSLNNYMSTKPLSEKTIGKIASALNYPYDLLIRGERYLGTNAYQKLEERVRRLEEIVFKKKGRPMMI